VYLEGFAWRDLIKPVGLWSEIPTRGVFKQDMEALTTTRRHLVGRTGREGSRFILSCVALPVVSILPVSLNNT
jgi:hypothetical protein